MHAHSFFIHELSGDKKADKKKKPQKSSPELRDLVRVFLGFSPEVRVNFRRFFSFYRLLGHPKLGIQYTYTYVKDSEHH